MRTANRRPTHRSFPNRELRTPVGRFGSSEVTRAMAKDSYDKVIEDSFPASDPPASSGITGPRATKPRPASHRRDDDSRPKGTPNPQSTETAQHEKKPSR